MDNTNPGDTPGNSSGSEPRAIELAGVGRPTIMTEATLQKLRTAFLMGCTDLQACAFAEIATGTLYNYQTAHPEFLEEKEAWKQNPILKAKAVIYENLKDPDVAKWYLERKVKDEFSQRNELTGAEGAPLGVKLEYVSPVVIDATTEPTTESSTDTVPSNPEATPGVATPDGQPNQ